MRADAARDVLRRQTAAAHRSLDGIWSERDLGERGDYVAFLRGIAGALLPIETALTRAGVAGLLPDWALRRRGAVLAADLAGLEHDDVRFARPSHSSSVFEGTIQTYGDDAFGHRALEGDDFALAHPTRSSLLSESTIQTFGDAAYGHRALDATWHVGRAPPMEGIAMFGALYVLEGSRLGGTLLARRVAASTDAAVLANRRFLEHGQGMGLWRGFLDRLERAAPSPDDLGRICDQAVQCFALFEAEARIAIGCVDA